MDVFEFTPEGTENCHATAYLQTGWKTGEMEKLPDLPAIVICPGGAYRSISDREAEPVAKEYLAANYHVFILYYSTGDKAQNFNALMELAALVSHIRRHGKEWHVDGNRLAVCGFSAGGHLAASLGTLYDEERFLTSFRASKAGQWNPQVSLRPNAMILGYPVITSDEFSERTSLRTVSGGSEGSEEYGYFGLDRHVKPNTPPAFLWHTSTDEGVPVENSLSFGAALSASRVPFELHVFPEGPHGMSVCSDEVGSKDSYNGRWVGWSILWLNRVFGHEWER